MNQRYSLEDINIIAEQLSDDMRMITSTPHLTNNDLSHILNQLLIDCYELRDALNVGLMYLSSETHQPGPYKAVHLGNSIIDRIFKA